VIKTCAAILVAWVVLGAVPATFAQHGIVPPLRTSGHQIVDAAGHPVRLTSVNWYGFDQKEFVLAPATWLCFLPRKPTTVVRLLKRVISTALPHNERDGRSSRHRGNQPHRRRAVLTRGLDLCGSSDS